jgi:hypothetical protein
MRKLFGVLGLAAASLAWFAMFVPALAGEEPKAEAKKPAAEGKDKAGWKDLLDGKSLKGWKTPKFGGEGKVSVQDGAVVIEQGESMSGIVYEGKDFPKMNYEVALEGKRTKGSDFFCTTTFPVGETHCSFVVGGWGGSLIGLSSINYFDASENETSKSKEFKENQWYKVRVRVTPSKIETWIDDEKLVNVTTKGKKISVRLECESCKPFGIATWCTAGAVRNIRVRSLTQEEIKAASAAAAQEEEN